jgi:hypothetical protein
MSGRRHAAISPLFHVQDRQVQVSGPPKSNSREAIRIQWCHNRHLSRAEHSNAIGSQKLSGLPYRGQVGQRRSAMMNAIKAFPSVPHPA